MANQVLSAVSLDDRNGIAADVSMSKITGIALKAALTGALTVTGVNQTDGTPAAWVIASGSTSFQAPPASGIASPSVAFSYASAADQGKAIVVYRPL